MRAIVRQPERAGNRAVLYLRQSKQREDSESIENQEYLGREYCAQHGYEVVDVHVDRVSGRKWDTRPGVKAVMDLIEMGHADVIVLWKWSRLSRSRLHWAVAADRVLSAGGRIEAVTEPLDTSTAAGRFARGVMTEYAAFQSEQIGEVWRETLDRRARQGKPSTGRPRFGYIRDRDADTYTPDPATVPAVRELFQRYMAGSGMQALARWLNSEGHRTGYGGLWNVSTTKRYMDRGFAAGLIYSNGKLLPGAHEAIIPPDEWEAYLARRATAVAPPRGTTRMLSGLMRCQCGGPMFLGNSSGGVGNYVCARRARGDDSCETRSTVSSRRAEAHLSAWVQSLPQQVEMLQEAKVKQAAQRTRSIEDRAAIARMIGRDEERLSNLTVLLLDGKITQSAYDATAQTINENLVSLRARYVRSAPMPTTDLLDRIPDMIEGWEELSPPAQNRVLRSIIRRIIVHRPVKPDQGHWSDRIEIIPRWEAEENDD